MIHSSEDIVHKKATKVALIAGMVMIVEDNLLRVRNTQGIKNMIVEHISRMSEASLLYSH